MIVGLFLFWGGVQIAQHAGTASTRERERGGCGVRRSVELVGLGSVYRRRCMRTPKKGEFDAERARFARTADPALLKRRLPGAMYFITQPRSPYFYCTGNIPGTYSRGVCAGG